MATSTELCRRLFIALLLPTAAAVLLWSFHVIELRRAVSEREPGDCAATERILFRVIVFICGLHGLVMLQLTEAPWIQAWAPQLAFVLVGALLVSVGNLLPTTRPSVWWGFERLGHSGAGTSGWRSTGSVDTSRSRLDSS